MATAFVPMAESAVFIFPANFIYGEWCGLEHPKSLNQAEPSIDEIDDACRLHDSAYHVQDPLGSSRADIELVNTLTDIIDRGKTWNRLPDGRRSPRTELTDKQFAVASAIASWFSGQKFIRIFVDIANGDYTAVLKLGTSSLRTVAVSSAIQKKLVTALSKEVRQVTGLEIDKFNLRQASMELNVTIIVDIADAADWVIDKVSDRSTIMVEKIGNDLVSSTPIGELAESLRRELDLPKRPPIKPVVGIIYDEFFK